MNNSNCRPEFFTDTPEFAALCFHIFSAIDVPLNVYGIYLILFKSSSKMGNMKYSLLSVHMWSTLCDFFIGTLIVPYLYFPLIAYAQMGVIRIFGIDPAATAYLAVVLVAELGASLTCMFENRHFHITKGSMIHKNIKKCEFRRWTIKTLNYVFPFVFSLPIFLYIPEQENVGGKALKILKCPTRGFYQLPMLLVSVEHFRASLIMLIAIFLYGSQCLIFIFTSVLHLHKQVQEAVVSFQTRKLERKYYYSVCIQLMIPFVVVAIPITYFSFCITFSYYNQSLNNIFVLIISNHGLIGTTAMILIYKEYRAFTQHLLLRKKEEPVRKNTIGSVLRTIGSERALPSTAVFSILN